MTARAGEKLYVAPGDRVSVILPYSEVCMHLRVAGQRMTVELLPSGGAQLIGRDGRPFSIPIGDGEAGFYRDNGGAYTYPDAPWFALAIRRVPAAPRAAAS